MHRSHKIRLEPNNVQATYFAKACGCARLAYNVGLARWKELYAEGVKTTGRQIRSWFNSIKAEKFPFVYEVTKCATDRPFDNLNVAFQRFFKGKSRYPKFKKKGSRDSFYIDNTKFRVDGRYAVIPKLGRVRMAERLRFSGKLISAVVSRKSDMWFVSITVDIPEEPKVESQDRKFVGIDMGIEKLATTSDGWYYENIRTTKRFAARLRLLNKSLSRKIKGSANREKAKIALSKLHYRIGCVRNDYLHKVTAEIAKDYTDVCLEDLNTSGMLKNSKLAKHISDASWYELRRQLSYKATVHLCGRFEPSSKTCSGCGCRMELKLSDRWVSCECGLEIDRDVNASINILRWASPEVKSVETKALV